MRARSLALAALAATAGCAQPGLSGPVAAPYAATLPPATGAMFATELAGRQTYLPPLPTAVILLRPDDMTRNRAFCQAALYLPTVQAAEAASVVAPNLIHTRWLVQIGDVPPARATDCDFLTGTYDYARAARLMQSTRLSQGSFAGRGPYLLMIIPDRTGLHVTGLDGSSAANAEMGAFIAGWGRALAESQARIATAPPDQPGIAKSLFGLIGAVLRGVASGAVGLVSGVLQEV